jgi:hypothetical protein
MVGDVARMGEKRNAYRNLVGKPEGKKPLGRPKRRWEDNIKMADVPSGLSLTPPQKIKKKTRQSGKN